MEAESWPGERRRLRAVIAPSRVVGDRRIQGRQSFVGGGIVWVRFNPSREHGKLLLRSGPRESSARHRLRTASPRTASPPRRWKRRPPRAAVRAAPRQCRARSTGRTSSWCGPRDPATRPPRHGQGLMGAAANNAGAKAHRTMPRALHVAAGDCDRLEDAGEHRARSHQPRWVTTLFFSRRAAAALTSVGARPQCGRSCKSRTRTFSGRTGRGCASRGRSGSSTRSCRR